MSKTVKNGAFEFHKVIASISFFSFIGCAAPHVMLDRGIIRNETRNPVTDVVIRHEPTGKTASINMILPSSSFDLGFSGQPMLGRQAIITWKDTNRRERRDEIDLPYNRDLKSDRKNMVLVYIIHSSGKVTVHLK